MTISTSLLGSDRFAKLSSANPWAERKSALKIVGRFGWALADQVLSSATNFLLGLIVARTVGARDLGGFSVAYATFTLSLGAVRAIAGDLLVVRYSAASAAEWRDGAKRSAGTAVIAGGVVGIGCLVTGTIIGEPSRSVLVIVGLWLPFLLVQDVWRFAFFARGRGRDAFWNDMVWAVALFSGFSVLRQAGVSSIAWFTCTWAAAGALAACVAAFQLRVVPSGPSEAIRWLRGHRDLAPRFFAEFVVGTGISSLILFAIGGISGLSELGRLRAGEIAVGPLNVLFLGAGLVATAEGVRLLQESRSRLAAGCGLLSVLVTAGVLSWGAIVVFLPDSVGENVLKANWNAARTLAPLLIAALVAHGVGFGALIGLRSLGAAKRSLRTKCIDASLTLLFAPTGAYLGGAQGAASGYAIAAYIKSLNAWWQFSRALREHQAPGPQKAAGMAVGQAAVVTDSPET